MAKRTLTAEQAAASRRRRARHLEDAVRALLASEGWARWVRVRSRNGLSRYSWFNQVQIAAQRPDATYVCGRGDWRRLGYDLADGQWRRPIWILAPFTGKQTETITDETGDGCAELERRYRYFRAVKVYDRSQVRPIDGAEPVDLRCARRAADGRLARPPARAAGRAGAVARATASSRARSDADGAQGWCDRRAREIVVNRQRPANARVRILVHEIAHAHPAGKLDYEHFTRAARRGPGRHRDLRRLRPGRARRRRREHPLRGQLGRARRPAGRAHLRRDRRCRGQRDRGRRRSR